MQLVTDVSDKANKPLLDKMMDIFRILIVEKFWREPNLLPNFFKSLKDGNKFFRRENADFLQGAGMSATRGQFVR
jgi:hypothetical protein